MIQPVAGDAQRRLGAINRRAYDEARRAVEVAVGDWVLVHDLALGQGHGTSKFRSTFSKPAQIMAKVTPLLYNVRYQDRRSRTRHDETPLCLQYLCHYVRARCRTQFTAHNANAYCISHMQTTAGRSYPGRQNLSQTSQ